MYFPVSSIQCCGTFRSMFVHLLKDKPVWVMAHPSFLQFANLDANLAICDAHYRSRGRKIRLIECNAKCRYLKKLACKGTLRQVFYLSEAPSPPITPFSLCPLHIRVGSILIHAGKGGERANQREG
jgi:hypothetical protein